EPRLGQPPPPILQGFGSPSGVRYMSQSSSSVPLTDAVGYLRRSSDSETQSTSIPDQRKAVEQYAREKGYRILRWYTDDAISGDDTKRREAFLRMTSDAQHLGDFAAILCWDRKRFGRFDSIEYGFYVFPLRQAGVVLVTVQDGLID